MVIYLEQVKIQELSENDIQTLRKLTNQGWSGSTMIQYLPRHQCSTPNKKCCYGDLDKSPCVFVARQTKGNIVGWSLIEKRGCSCCADNVHTYVDNKYRNMGIGKLLVGEVLSVHKKKVSCFKINKAAEKMYNSFPRLQKVDDRY